MVLGPREEALHDVDTELLIRKPRPSQIASKLIQICLQLSKAYTEGRMNDSERDSFELEQKKKGGRKGRIKQSANLRDRLQETSKLAHRQTDI